MLEWRQHAALRRAFTTVGSFDPDPQPTLSEGELVAALEEPDAYIRDKAVWWLVQIRSTSPALVRPLVERLESETEESRWQNRWDPLQVNPAEALKQMHLPPAVIAPLLRKAMASKEPWIRLQAIDVLRDAAERPGPPAPTLAELLLAALQDEELMVRVRVAEAIAHLDAGAAPSGRNP